MHDVDAVISPHVHCKYNLSFTLVLIVIGQICIAALIVWYSPHATTVHSVLLQDQRNMPLHEYRQNDHLSNKDLLYTNDQEKESEVCVIVRNTNLGSDNLMW